MKKKCIILEKEGKIEKQEKSIKIGRGMERREGHAAEKEKMKSKG